MSDNAENLVNRENKILNFDQLKDSQKSVSDILTALGSQKENQGSLELTYNTGSKNVILAAKTSELRKRLNLIQQVLNWSPDQKQSISSMLKSSNIYISFLDERKMKEQKDKVNYLFDGIFSILEQKEEKKFSSEFNNMKLVRVFLRYNRDRFMIFMIRSVQTLKGLTSRWFRI